VQHNNLHHYHLSEDTDPDLVERNLAVLRGTDAPWPVKWFAVLALAGVWKWFYYAVRCLCADGARAHHPRPTKTAQHV